MSAPSPHVAFGLRAATVALKARTGRRVALAEVLDLAGFWLTVAPEDDRVGAAVARFLAELHVDGPAAGARLLDFIEAWVAPAAADARAAAGILDRAEAECAALPDWTRRADCGVA